MWKYAVRLILRYRLFNLILVGLITLFMGYQATKVSLSYEMVKMLPSSDSTSIIYDQFKQRFGQDGNILFIGFKDEHMFSLSHYNALHDLTIDIKAVEGVQDVVSVAKIYTLVKNEEKKQFDFVPIIPTKPKTQVELDSLKQIVFSQPLYNGLLYNKKRQTHFMMITLDKNAINNKGRIALITSIKNKIETHSQQLQIKAHYSGLPYIRTFTSKKVESELKLFTLLSMIIASLVLLLFFRSFKAVLFSMLVVLITVLWSFGSISLLGYKITILTGIIPPLLIIIVVENCIFLLNKYHSEYKSHGNKVKSLSRIVQRVGGATLLTNLTTAIGFATFIITQNKILVEFGIVASINILFAFLLSIFLIPILFSYVSAPDTRHMKHLENRNISFVIGKVVNSVLHYRKTIYITTIIIVLLSIYGVTKLTTTGNVVDDIPKSDVLYTDLMFFEENVHGIMPFEIIIDTKKKKGVMQLSTLKRIDKLQDTLATYGVFSKPLSVVEVVKSAKQAFYNGDTAYYNLPNSTELAFMSSYLPQGKENKKSIINSFVDSNYSATRVSVQMANIGTKEIQRIKDDLQPKIDSLFNPAKYDVQLTGTSVVFLKGTDYLVHNLASSLVFAIILISLLMAGLFTSARMILISIIPNLIPLLTTAALMGYFGISIKPSTIIVFSIALGIAVDNAIHFLSKYRQELRVNHWSIKKAVIAALKETSYSMVYSSVVLVLGFSVFITSEFGGTVALGLLISLTLLAALFSNLFLLPSFLLSLDKMITTKSFKEPIIDIFEEEKDDIPMEEIEIEELAEENKTTN